MRRAPRRGDPRGPSRSAPTSGQRRCLRSGAGGSAAGSVVVRVSAGLRPGTLGERQWGRPLAVERDIAVVCAGTRVGCSICGCSTHRARWAEASATASTALTQIRPVGSGRPRSRPSLVVAGLLSPAVRSRLLERGPTTHVRTPHRSSGATRGFFGPPLAGTDTDTNEARRDTVTRLTGTGHGYVRTRNSDTGTPGAGPQMRPRHSSSNVIASDVPGLPSASL